MKKREDCFGHIGSANCSCEHCESIRNDTFCNCPSCKRQREENKVTQELTRKDLLCEGAHVGTGERVIGWYCEGNVLEGGKDDRERISYIIPVYPDLRKSTTGVTSLHGFVEVVPESVSLAEIQNNEE